MHAWSVALVIVLALGFTYTNGFHDAANAVATSVSTRVLTPRIAVAKDVLDRLVTETLPDGVPAALRIFKAGKKSCDTQLLVPLGPLDGAAMAQQVRDLRINKGTKTPLGAILLDAVGDLGGATGVECGVEHQPPGGRGHEASARGGHRPHHRALRRVTEEGAGDLCPALSILVAGARARRAELARQLVVPCRDME